MVAAPLVRKTTPPFVWLFAACSPRSTHSPALILPGLTSMALHRCSSLGDNTFPHAHSQSALALQDVLEI